jgi:uroporphyrinogen decarboxylase
VEASRVNHKERVRSALAREGYDRLPVRYVAEPVVTENLLRLLDLSDHDALLGQLGDDLRYVQPRYMGPEPQVFQDGSYESSWPGHAWPVGEHYKDVCYGDGTYAEAAYLPFQDVDGPGGLSKHRFPVADWFDYSTIKDQCEAKAEYALVTGQPGVLDFINGIAHSRGIEQVFMDIALERPVYLVLMERKFSFQYALIENTLRASEGMIDIVHGGEDFATQRGLLISPKMFDRLFAPKYERFFAMVHSFGAKTMLHVCGSSRGLLPRLIELGLDILDVVQVSAEGMDIRGLAKDFGDDLSFCGTMDVQKFMPSASVEQIQAEVALRRTLFADGGLIIGPSHNIQIDTPLENILTIYRAAGSLI